jgi:hypothetical protein
MLNNWICTKNDYSFRFGEKEGILMLTLQYIHGSYDITNSCSVDLDGWSHLGFIAENYVMYYLNFIITQNQDKWLLFWWACARIIGFMYLEY